MLAGVLAGLATGALWGLIFIAPLAVAPFSGIDLAIGRYLIFAATSLLVFAVIPASRRAHLTPREIAVGIGLGIVGYGSFYGFLVIAVSHAGPQISALVIGLLPILLAIIGNLDGGKLPWKALAAPILLIGTGLLTVHGTALIGAPTPDARSEIALGILAALGSVASWICFSVFNARALTNHPGMNTLAWTGLHGIGAGIGILIFGALAVPFGIVNAWEHGLHWPEAKNLLVWAVITGLFGSWVASYLWVVATKRLPLVISGQLFVGEPAFGVIYGFLWEGRWPQPVEAFGAVCLFAGVLLGIAAFGRHRNGLAAGAAHL